MTDAGLEKSREQRKEKLDVVLMDYGARGWRIENRSDYQAMVAKGKHISHRVHIFLSIITLGLWLFVYGVRGLIGSIQRRMVTVDPYGNVHEQKVNRR